VFSTLGRKLFRFNGLQPTLLQTLGATCHNHFTDALFRAQYEALERSIRGCVVVACESRLWSILQALDQRYRIAPIHGDLHGENVRVRGTSAILIDLASVMRGPLTADLAALETWLAFELPPSKETDEQRFFDAPWAAVIRWLYASSAFRHPPGPARPASPFAWLEAVVRQIRTMGIAIQSCATEYQSAVAVQLLRRCQWADGSPGDRGPRTVGYEVASRLAADLEGVRR
jgi:hypothetical protein